MKRHVIKVHTVLLNLNVSTKLHNDAFNSWETLYIFKHITLTRNKWHGPLRLRDYANSTQLAEEEDNEEVQQGIKLQRLQRLLCFLCPLSSFPGYIQTHLFDRTRY